MKGLNEEDSSVIIFRIFAYAYLSDAFNLGLEVRGCWPFEEDKELITNDAAGVLEGNLRTSEITLRLIYHDHTCWHESYLNTRSQLLTFLACIMQQLDGCRFLQASWISNEKSKITLVVLRKLNIAVTSHFLLTGELKIISILISLAVPFLSTDDLFFIFLFWNTADNLKGFIVNCECILRYARCQIQSVVSPVCIA